MDLPENENKTGRYGKYLSIKKAFESKEVYTDIAFLTSIMTVFDEVITKFQREEPLIHLSYPDSEKL